MLLPIILTAIAIALLFAIALCRASHNADVAAKRQEREMKREREGK